jgi:hypothetical protein
MSARNFPYWKIRVKNRGGPKIDVKSGDARKVSNTDYHQSIPQHLAYNGCTKVRDEITGKLHNFTQKDHLIRSYVAIRPLCAWSKDRERFANAIMTKGLNHPNARLGRSVVAACPDGLSKDTFTNQGIAYANYLSGRFGTTVFVDFHDPKKTNSKEQKTGLNIHAHYFFPTYTVTPQGFGEKLRELDLKTQSSKVIEELREEWARIMERGFELQGDDVQMEHRSYKRQKGIDKKPEPKIGSAASGMHARGEQTDRMKLWNEVRADNARGDEMTVEEKALRDEIDRLEALPNIKLPKRLVGKHTIDDNVNQCSYEGTHVYAQRTYEWLTAHFTDEPMLTSLFEDFELLLDGPRPLEETIPELPPEPNIGDLFESIAMWIDRLQLRKRPRPHYA